MESSFNSNTIIIILNWNNSEKTIDLVEKIRVLEDTPIIVVDNGSNTKESQFLFDYFNRINGLKLYEDELSSYSNEKCNKYFLLFLNKNYGYAKGNNYGLQLSIKLGFKYSLICNNDVFFDKPIIKELEAIIGLQNNVAVLGPRVLDTKNNQQGPYFKRNYFLYSLMLIFYPLFYLPIILSYRLRLRYYASSKKNILLVYRVMGCCMLLKNSAIKNVQMFDESTFLYSEEEILAERLKMINQHFAYTNKVTVHHLHAFTTNKLGEESRYKIHLQSVMYYLYKYLHYSSFKLFIVRKGYDSVQYLWGPILRQMRIKFNQLFKYGEKK
jgi:hypothetical protein